MLSRTRLFPGRSRPIRCATSMSQSAPRQGPSFRRVPRFAGSLASQGPSLRSFLFFMLGDTIEENVEHPVG